MGVACVSHEEKMEEKEEKEFAKPAATKDKVARTSTCNYMGNTRFGGG